MRHETSVWIVGARGMLGGALVAEAASRGLAAFAATRGTIDLSRPDLIPGAVLAAPKPIAMINAAAFTDVARCEDVEVAAEVFAVNRDAPGVLARLCSDLGIPFVHVSTDYVFDGLASWPYREEDPPNPVQVYGRSKLEGEAAVFSANPLATIVRVSTLFGPGDRPRPHYVDAVLSQLRSKSRIEVVRTPTSSPTYAPDAARGVFDLLEKRSSGLFHLVNEGGCSRLELSRAIADASGVGGRVEILGRPEPEGGMRRPPYSVLDTAKLAALLGRGLRPWREALVEYLRVHRGAPS